MRICVFSIILFAALSAYAAQANDQIGFKEITVPPQQDGRSLTAGLWYPTNDAGLAEIVADNPVFRGVAVVKNANPANGPHPLVVLSHGYGGSWRNLSWLAGELAHQGYVVAAPNHPGTTTFDRDPQQAARLWERPRDMSRVVDTLLADQHLSTRIAKDRIAAIGHSLGGWTVAELAGGRFDGVLVTQNCETRFGPVMCKIIIELGIGQSPDTTERLAGDLSDKRIGAVVALDLGPARGFTPESLAGVHMPFLVIAAGADIGKEDAAKAQVAATNKDSLYVAEHLPAATTRLAMITDALHFSFMQICKPGAIEIIEEETPGEGIVCKDGGTRDRTAIHRETVDMIIGFLAKAIPAK